MKDFSNLLFPLDKKAKMCYNISTLESRSSVKVELRTFEGDRKISVILMPAIWAELQLKVYTTSCTLSTARELARPRLP